MSIDRNAARKAGALVPLAVLSAGWTTMLATAGAGAASGDGSGGVPTPPLEAIEAPASVGMTGASGPSARALAAPRSISGLSSDGIPAAALAAYQRAAQVITSADPGCHLPWSLIAAIGRVESDHGRFGGNVLSTDGVATPGIFGAALDGTKGTARVRDTDAGLYDGDPELDRAVGPMQFIPSTWQVVSVDGDGDQKRNPQDIDDAALATAVYLCSGDGDLATESGVSEAVYRYNHSHDYVALVKSVADRYEAGTFTPVATRTYGVTTFGPSYADGGKPAKSGKTVREVGGSTALSTPSPKPTKPLPTTTPGPAAPHPAKVTKPKNELAEVVNQVPAQVQQTLDGGAAAVNGLLASVGGLVGSLLGKP